MKVFFIGAGPGDPELITVKALKAIEKSPVILYAGSLVPKQIIEPYEASAAKIIDTASIDLEEIIAHIVEAQEKGQNVARVHSGDPSVYGAIGEQIRRLESLGIDYEIIPGVTATSASAAWLGKELTLSGVSQTIIMTRYEGKTPFPERERLPALAASGATLAIHLGVTRIHKIVEELIPHYGEDCPVAVCYRTTWPDQDKVTGTLKDIVEKVRAKKFTRTSLILVGHVLGSDDFRDSYLYDQDKAHVYRPKVKKPVARDVQSTTAHPTLKSS
ncbi:Precorrin-4 C(11)-methyltransferase [BD1-7 clade bacterium]|uniref:Precorrin-4 C(11)-methyltransferase n=1 Tax=BD1-7 clade bacterium TaxID=2029982 RepID=A0A5S9PC34_9GAMM|nr:Precorrin-4 C(11)-methyltransferase [BD1-7 clade bacterium]CAA0101252.1 Precorrin-4 C(11)-methyltransferase [BD1-7 clade bacterium]CAA0102136.1 Precorrin-4 C(11)-methyltransferase [BD1-7 clade bacterium]